MGDDASSSSPAPANQAAEVWKLLGRDTPGGKALYNLYGGNSTGKNVGQGFHQRNKQLHDKKLATGWRPQPAEAPPPPEFQRPQVNYPKFGKQRSNSADMNAARLHQIPRRRPAELIQKELEEEQQRMRAAPPPKPRGPLLDEAEKARLADMMRFRGEVPEASAKEREEAAAHRGARQTKPRNQREELQAMFEAVAEEVEERRAFLADLERAGGLKKDHVHQIRAEIKVRVEDMNRIDRLLQDLQ